MKIEFENSIRRFELFVPSTRHQNCLDKSLTTFFLQSFKSGSPSALMFAIIKQSHLLLIKYLNHHIEPILTEKISITIGDINSWNKTKYKFSNLSLKT